MRHIDAEIAACGPRAEPPSGAEPTPAATPAPGAPQGLRLSDVTAEAGIDFIHDNARSERKLLPETMGSGVAFFDYDGDSRPDLYLANGAPLDRPAAGARPGALYRNLDGLHFEEVTSEAGLGEAFYAMGVAVGDYDNDGLIDLFVSGVGRDRLYRNLGGRFQDVTAATGLDRTPGFSSSAAFLDFDRDGDLDLFAGRYVSWTLASDVACTPDGAHRSYCTPERYPGESSRLYLNVEGRAFEDVTERAGLWRPEGKTLGVAVVDYNLDGWPDLAVANDTVRNFLFVNNRDGTFSELSVTADMAYSESGATRGGMGIDTGDADGDGHEDVVIGNFAYEMAAYYRGSPSGHFTDDAPQSGIGLPTLMTLAFGTLLVDLDRDGHLDIVFANGHIEPDIERLNRQSYRQPLQVFRNDGRGRFEPLAPPAFPAELLVGRGLAAADMDGDGNLDLAVTQNGGPMRLLRNDSKAGNWLRVRPEGVRSPATGYGVRLVATAGERVWRRTLRSGSSYLSASEPVLTLGLGDVTQLDRIQLEWPSGASQVIDAPALNQTLVIEEP